MTRETPADDGPLGGFLAAHAAACRQTVERWMLRSLPVPLAVLEAVWADPSWRAPLSNVVVVPLSSEGARQEDAAGILREAERGRGLRVVNLDGVMLWLQANQVALPHPAVLRYREELGEMLRAKRLSQGLSQLGREVFARPADGGAAAALAGRFAGVVLPSLEEAEARCAAAGSALRDGAFLARQARGPSAGSGRRAAAACAVWGGTRWLEARLALAAGEDGAVTTGVVSWVEADGREVPPGEVPEVAFSEGLRMAAVITAGGGDGGATS